MVSTNRDMEDVAIHPNGRVPRHDALNDLDLGLYCRALVNPGSVRVEGKRELAWMERNLGQGLHRAAAGASHVPFALLAEHGPKARRRTAQRALQGISPEQHLERYMPLAEQTYRDLCDNWNGYSQRTLTQAATSAGAATGTVVDIARSIMWLTEMDAALEMMTVVPGLSGQWQGFYGNVNPAEDWVAEGDDLTETTPTLVRLQRTPKTLGMQWGLSNAQMAAGGEEVAMAIEVGCEQVVRTRAMRAFLSGDDVGASFANDANAIDGLMNSAITETGFGSAITDLGRGDMLSARRRLFADEVDLDNVGWILGSDVATQLEKTARHTGGSEFLYQGGMVDCGAQWVPARDTIHLGKTGIDAPAVLLDRSAAVCLLWGPGIMMNALRTPGESETKYDLQLQCNFAMLNPNRAEVIKQA